MMWPRTHGCYGIPCVCFQGNWQIKPRLANLLANSELYCQACRNMFGENASQWQGILLGQQF